ncbi:helix-turn-helix transcriptional regulator [Psychromonas sp. Urea-02u-13]|uniref:helix-turn-helix transcriptional regulator n=1 Tax=Psychromonas sp. Urea-02u-13 TaxID=2058326 RepID=UPI000C32F980|nr:LuxR C-terminal-related transcriptional regulator [Psychromonas sp. Urea-02u-13]PKG37717.1 hypothetical protein CXF74_17435 [Psychromonas sp. Urea-02u-13]
MTAFSKLTSLKIQEENDFLPLDDLNTALESINDRNAMHTNPQALLQFAEKVKRDAYALARSQREAQGKPIYVVSPMQIADTLVYSRDYEVSIIEAFRQTELKSDDPAGWAKAVIKKKPSKYIVDAVIEILKDRGYAPLLKANKFGTFSTKCLVKTDSYSEMINMFNQQAENAEIRERLIVVEENLKMQNALIEQALPLLHKLIPLTKVERPAKILELHEQGMTNKEISELLNVSTKTVGRDLTKEKKANKAK